jgi:hypothetical protein
MLTLLDPIVESALERMDLVRWVWKILLSSEAFQVCSYCEMEHSRTISANLSEFDADTL